MNNTKRHLHRFHGGLHLPAHKDVSSDSAVVSMPLPKRLVLPLSQHIGEPAEALVKPGERVLKGQMIAQARGLPDNALQLRRRT